ncbi:prephenate dehydrogenase [Aeromicrobium sp. 636]|uniref:Prephenate dehydrogenase n=1 Tax=Aeromicrobium senzhongii TaxID=2663859 RepID=A0A8I0ETF1_9ACTN|nr:MULTISPECIES: prephenate dehydrogenase [Aeromicrobium]MBC9224705.1 prephenate dehydrogenase [Aeromicrobium senzhongii]MCQ3996818.1 prephenate dehydrogenase [Aeromicrobium sp. 636]MTB86750.1 prephenate dehydrogenase [Aeromicrobium senzhongii]QNL93401.1 prephenate dehydrogenase [Aeromicrobium senzhongii]
MSAPLPDAVVPGPVLVIGCGLIGTSVALALRDLDVPVHLRDASASHLEIAASVGAGSPDPVESPALVVVAVPPAAVVETVRSALAEFPQAVVTDVASVKGSICAEVTDPRFVGGHPMAGKERSGPMAASGLLFEGRAWAVVPTEGTDPDAVALVERVATSVGAVVRRMDAASHDRAVALVSHVPHLVSSLTAGLLTEAPTDDLALAGQGLRDVIRIAGSDRGLWVDIIGSNAGQVGDILDDLAARLDDLRAAVRAGDGSVAEHLDRGRDGVSRVPGKHGEQPTALGVVFVSIDDTPGELSRLFSDIGAAGVNIEDMRIDHELGRLVGVVEVVVQAAAADVLHTALIERGWAAFR